MLCTCSPRGSPVSQEAESTESRRAIGIAPKKSRLATPNFSHVHTPAHPMGVGVSNGELCGGRSGPFAWDTLPRHFTAIPGRGGLKPPCAHMISRHVKHTQQDVGSQICMPPSVPPSGRHCWRPAVDFLLNAGAHLPPQCPLDPIELTAAHIAAHPPAKDPMRQVEALLHSTKRGSP